MDPALLRDRNGSGRPALLRHLSRLARRIRRARGLAAAAALAATISAPAWAEDPARTAEDIVVETAPVTVTATRTARRANDSPTHTTVIERAEIEASGARTLPELLRRQPGLYVTNTTTTPRGASVESRGFANGGGNGCRTLLLIDGLRVNELATGCPDWSVVPLDDIERVEIVRGPVGAVHGGGAVGGVIHVRTRRPAEGARASVGLRAGAYSDFGVSASASGSAGALGIRGFHETHETDGYRDRADFRAESSRLTLAYRPERGFFAELQGGIASHAEELPGALRPEQLARDRRQAQTNGDDRSTTRTRFLQAVLGWRGDALELSLRPYSRRQHRTGFLSGPSFVFAQESELDVLGVEAQASGRASLLGVATRWLVGGDVRQEDVNTGSASVFFGFPTTSRGDARRDVWGAFAQAEVFVTPDLTLTAGVRRDDSDIEGLADGTFSPRVEDRVQQSLWSPRVALNWRIAERLSAYASWSRGARFPNLDETFGFFGVAPKLRPEKAESVELGINWQDERSRVQLSVYDMTVEDEIFFNPIAANPVGLFDGINDNVDEVKHRGVELAVQVALTEWLDLTGSTTFEDVEITDDSALLVATGDRFAGSEMPITPRHRGFVGLDARLPFGVRAGVHARYVGSRRVSNYFSRTDARLGKFAVYDARVGWSHAFPGGWTLALDAVGHNLTDRAYSEFGGWSPFSQFVGKFPSPGRHYSVSARITIER